MSARNVARAILGACFRYALPPIVGDAVHDLAFGPAFDKLWPAVEASVAELVAASFEQSMPGSLIVGDFDAEQRALALQTIAVLDSWSPKEQRTLKAQIRALAEESAGDEQQAMARDVAADLAERLGGHSRFRDLISEMVAGRRERFDVPAGTELAKRYLVLSELGRGGMGLVLRVADRMLRQREFALKLALRDDEAQRQRFEQEAVIGHDLQGESGFLGALHYGEVELAGKSRPFFVMRLVLRARTLNLLEGSREQRLRSVLRAARRVARFHELGFVHRDIKPQNFLLDGNGEVLLADFGLARHCGAPLIATERLTNSGQGMGTPLYMAPEQEDAKRVDARADVYSLGVMLFEAWEGRRPGRSELMRILYQAPESFRGHEAWLELLRSSLDDAERRIQDGRELAKRLAPLIEPVVDPLAEDRARLASERERIESEAKSKSERLERELRERLENETKSRSERLERELRERFECESKSKSERLERELRERMDKEFSELKSFKEKAQQLATELARERSESARLRQLGSAPGAPPQSGAAPLASSKPARGEPNWSLLSDIKKWEAASEPEQDAIIEAIAARASLGLQNCQIQEYSCGASRQRIATFTHRSGVELNLIPGGSLRRGFKAVEEAVEILRSDFNGWSRGLGLHLNFDDSWLKDAPYQELSIPPLLVGNSPITQEQWKRWTGESIDALREKEGGYSGQAGLGPSHPVYSVNWIEADSVSRKNGLRLLSEAEWEWMARGGNSGLWCFGDELERLDEFAWTWRNSKARSHRVKGLKPNSFGLYDVHGNVFEWCADIYGPYGEGDSAAPRQGAAAADRVIRGGSWYDSAARSSAACRYGGAPGIRGNVLGLRVALSID